MEKILHYLLRMIPAAALGLGLYGLSRPFRMRRLRWRSLRTNPRHELALCLFLMFLTGLLWLTVLPRISWADGRLMFSLEGFGEINLKPFLIFEQSRILAQRGTEGYFLINFWGNILMFVPIGFCPALLWRRGRWWKAMASGLCLSLTIEFCQIFISRGTDIDDLWLNTLGAALGYGVYALLRRLWPERTERYKVREVSPWT